MTQKMFIILLPTLVLFIVDSKMKTPPQTLHIPIQCLCLFPFIIFRKFVYGYQVYLCVYLHISCVPSHIQVTSWRTLGSTETHYQDKTQGNGREATSDCRVKGRRPTVTFPLKTDLRTAERQKRLGRLSVTLTNQRLHL